MLFAAEAQPQQHSRFVTTSGSNFGYRTGGRVKRQLGSAVLTLAVLLLAYSRLVAPRWLNVTRLRVGLPGVDQSLHGMRIAHLSDFHVGGPGTRSDILMKARREAIDFRPDMIAITGDFFDEGSTSDEWSPFIDWPAGVPVIAVFGNHDYRRGAGHIAELRRRLENSGVTFLANSALSLSLRGETVWIAGADDPHTRRDDLAATLDEVPVEAGPPLVLLVHSPSIVNELEAGAVRLVLAGHTHGGQVRLTPSGRIPFIGLIRRLRGLRPQPSLPLARGWHWWRGTVVVISDGLGLSSIPLRFRTRPQVILIELVETPAGGPPCDDVRRYVNEVRAPSGG